tara:strand:- start:67 stop:729 length:663 start_codon:yes stop_codon:yes gene_type:complete
MCGRNTIFSDKNKIKKELKVDIWKNEEDFSPTYNLSPTQYSPVLVKNTKRAIYPMRWGFGFKSSMRPIFNARAETLEKKTSFKDLIAKNRCVIISNGFFEWKRSSDSKIPYYIHHSDGKIIAMAGLCKWDRDLDGNRKLVYTIITKEARPSLEKIHHREPVMLTDRSLSSWINVNEPCRDPLSLLNDNTDRISSYEVSKFVNKSSNNSQECISRIDYAKN